MKFTNNLDRASDIFFEDYLRRLQAVLVDNYTQTPRVLKLIELVFALRSFCEVSSFLYRLEQSIPSKDVCCYLPTEYVDGATLESVIIYHDYREMDFAKHPIDESDSANVSRKNELEIYKNLDFIFISEAIYTDVINAPFHYLILPEPPLLVEKFLQLK